MRRRGAILGFGNVAEKGHLPAWLERTDVEIVAVADSTPERCELARGLLPSARIYDDASVLLEKEAPDFVDIAAPPRFHVPLIEAAANGGAQILCEKPLATGVEDLRRAVKAVRSANVILFTVHNWKHSPHCRQVMSFVEQGSLGELRKIRFETVRNGQSVTVGQDWRTQAAISGGGILVDHGWHAFYLMMQFAQQPPIRVRAALERRRYVEADVEDTVDCAIEFPSLVGEISLTWAGTERRTGWTLEGTLGTLTLREDRLEIDTKVRRESHRLDASLSAGSHHADWFAPVIDGFFAEIDGQRPRGENLREAEVCLALLTGAYDSGRQGGEFVPVPSPQRE